MDETETIRKLLAKFYKERDALDRQIRAVETALSSLGNGNGTSQRTTRTRSASTAEPRRKRRGRPFANSIRRDPVEAMTALVDIVRRDPGLNSTAYCKELGKTRTATTQLMIKAREANLLRMEGQRRGAKWFPVE